MDERTAFPSQGGRACSTVSRRMNGPRVGPRQAVVVLSAEATCPTKPSQWRMSRSRLINLYPSWGTEAVWFDFDAREIRHQADADALSDFIRMLGQAVGRPVELSYEGRDEEVFATYAPDRDEFEWSDAP